MKWIAHAIAAFLLLLLSTCQPYRVQEQPDPQSQHLDMLERMTEDELRRELEECILNDRQLEPCLYEFVRRGSPNVELLYWALDNLHRTVDDTPLDLELLTAIRRLEHANDPLRIETNPSGTIELEYPAMPEFSVTPKNVDDGGFALTLIDGGDYRSGRRERFRFEAMDEHGRALPVLPRWSCMSGGICCIRRLSFGDTGSTVKLRTRDYLLALPPGRYQVRVQYSNTSDIAHLDSVAGRIVHFSSPIHLKILPRTIRLTEADHRLAKRRAEQLDDRLPIRFIDGSYDEECHSFLSPDSPAGALLGMGWKAVPVLIDHLSSRLSPIRRAWTLALLFSLTGQNDPRPDWFDAPVDGEVLGDYEYLCRPWSFSSTPETCNGGKGSGSRLQISEQKQKDFAENWSRFRGYYVVEWE